MFVQVLTHRLEAFVSSFDSVNKKAIHPFLGQNMNAAVKKSDHDGISLIRHVRFVG
jgi:hypothetical protein